MEHDIALRAAYNRSQLVGRLVFSIEFQHLCSIEAHLSNIKLEIEGPQERKLYLTLQSQTPEGTIDSEHKTKYALPQFEPAINHSILVFPNSVVPEDSMPYVKFHTTYAHLTLSCIRISFRFAPESGSLSSSHERKGSNVTVELGDYNQEKEEKPEKCKDQPEGKMCDEENPKALSKINDFPDVKIVDKYESDPMFGECYISFPKLLGKEMTVLEESDRTAEKTPTAVLYSLNG